MDKTRGQKWNQMQNEAKGEGAPHDDVRVSKALIMPGERSLDAASGSSGAASPPASAETPPASAETPPASAEKEEGSGEWWMGAERPSWPLSLLPQENTCQGMCEMIVA